MLLSEFDFPFDPTLVADHPVTPRDRARLLVMERSTGARLHRHVADLSLLLRRGDLLVVNDTKVMQARVPVRAGANGKFCDLLFVADLGGGLWEILIKGRWKPGAVLTFSNSDCGTIVERSHARTTLRLNEGARAYDLMQAIGTMPLPPYIKRMPTQDDLQWYQTVFARNEGAIAAPTAGLHFTRELVQTLRGQGIELAQVTLHVGPGTFRGVQSERIEEHRMLAERVDVPIRTVEQIRLARERGNRVVAVGTTVVRALETAALGERGLEAFQGAAELFITPGYEFRVVDALVTNFHLPRTTLLMLVSAFVGVERLRAAYAEAVSQRYRFYSYGDAMLIGTGWADTTSTLCGP